MLVDRIVRIAERRDVADPIEEDHARDHDDHCERHDARGSAVGGASPRGRRA
jgi:hypothetical protein